MRRKDSYAIGRPYSGHLLSICSRVSVAMHTVYCYVRLFESVPLLFQTTPTLCPYSRAGLPGGPIFGHFDRFLGGWTDFSFR